MIKTIDLLFETDLCINHLYKRIYNKKDNNKTQFLDRRKINLFSIPQKT